MSMSKTLKWEEDFSWKCGICGKKRRDVQPVQDFEVGDACPEHYEGIEVDNAVVAE
jgi:hypothetical protein